MFRKNTFYFSIEFFRGACKRIVNAIANTPSQNASNRELGFVSDIFIICLFITE